MAENTDTKFLDKFNDVINRAAADPIWQPPNPQLEVAAMRARYDAGLAAVEDIPIKFHPHQININNRQDAYAVVKPLTRKSRGVLRSSAATEKEVADGETLIRKILGQRAAPKPKSDPTTPENEAAGAHSVSQLSYASQEGNVRSYGVYLGNVLGYKVNEIDITAAAFAALADTLAASSQQVSLSFTPWKNTLALRDQLLYDNPDSIFEVVRKAKEYYKGIHEGNPAQYQLITKLQFTKPKRRKR